MNYIDQIKMEINLHRKARQIDKQAFIAEVDAELKMLDKFERWTEGIEKDLIKQQEEFDKLMDSHQYLGNEIDRLAEFIMTNIEGEPSKNEGAIDTAIRLLSNGGKLL